MGSKNSPGKFDCYAAADPDEPMFVLLGRDPSAGALVRLWAQMRPDPGEEAKVKEARDCADALDAWCRDLGKRPRGFASLSPNASPIRPGDVVKLKQWPGPRMGVRSVFAAHAPEEWRLSAKVFWYGEDQAMHETTFPVDMLEPWVDPETGPRGRL